MKSTLKKKNEQIANSNNIVIVFVLIALISLTIMIIALCMAGKDIEPQDFIPPAFDENAAIGTPQVSDHYGYDVLFQEGMSFKVGLCGIVKTYDLIADVYLTNVSDNSLWLKVRIYDDKGNIIGESGIIKPGEYIKSVQLNQKILENTKIRLKIMSYEPDTYYSGGSIVITPMIKIEK